MEKSMDVEAGLLVVFLQASYSLSRPAVDLSCHRKTVAVKGRIADLSEWVLRENNALARQVPSESSNRSRLTQAVSSDMTQPIWMFVWVQKWID